MDVQHVDILLGRPRPSLHLPLELARHLASIWHSISVVVVEAFLLDRDQHPGLLDMEEPFQVVLAFLVLEAPCLEAQEASSLGDQEASSQAHLEAFLVDQEASSLGVLVAFVHETLVASFREQGDQKASPVVHVIHGVLGVLGASSLVVLVEILVVQEVSSLEGQMGTFQVGLIELVGS